MRLNTDPAKLVRSCGLNAATAHGLLSGRFHRLNAPTVDRLMLLLLLFPDEQAQRRARALLETGV